MPLVSYNTGILSTVGAIGSLAVVGLTLASGAIKLRNDWSSRNTWTFSGAGGQSGLSYLALAIGVVAVISFSGYLVASALAILLGEEGLAQIRASKLAGSQLAAMGSIAGAMGLGLVATPLVYHLLASVTDVGRLQGSSYEVRSDLVLALAAIPSMLTAAGAILLLTKKTDRRSARRGGSWWSAWRSASARLLTPEPDRQLVQARFLFGFAIAQVPAVIFIALFTHASFSVNPIPFGGGP